MAKQSTPSKEILEAALHGLEAQKEKLDEQISEVRSMLGGGRGRPSRKSGGPTKRTPAAGARKRRPLSAEARKRIAAAQKKRWAAFRKNQQ
jgi:hypothetical protein